MDAYGDCGADAIGRGFCNYHCNSVGYGNGVGHGDPFCDRKRYPYGDGVIHRHRNRYGDGGRHRDVYAHDHGNPPGDGNSDSQPFTVANFYDHPNPYQDGHSHQDGQRDPDPDFDSNRNRDANGYRLQDSDPYCHEFPYRER